METDFGDDEGLGCDCGECLGERTKDCDMLVSVTWLWLHHELTECFKGLQSLLSGVQDLAQPLISAVCDGRVHYKHQTCPQSSPETCPAVVPVDNIHGSRNHAFSLRLAHGLLPRRHNGDRDCEQLGKRAGYSTEGKLDSGTRRCLEIPVRHIQTPDNGVPVKVGKVGRRHAEQSASHASIKARDTFLRNHLAYRVHGTIVVFFIGRIGSAGGRGALNLYL